jgi:undecaprenyl-diphosphatase
MRNSILNEFFLGITFGSSEIIIFFVLTTMFLYNENKRRWILPLLATLASSVVVGFAIKFFVHRLRPFQLGLTTTIPILEKASHTVWNFSFPSFQSMLVFCAVPILSKEFPRFKKIWILFAVLVAFSRVYFGLHFASDVIFGGIMGYLIGIVLIKFEEKYKVGENISKRLSKLIKK